MHKFQMLLLKRMCVKEFLINFTTAYFNFENVIMQTFNIKLISISKQLKVVDCLTQINASALARLALSNPNQQNYEIETFLALSKISQIYS